MRASCQHVCTDIMIINRKFNQSTYRVIDCSWFAPAWGLYDVERSNESKRILDRQFLRSDQTNTNATTIRLFYCRGNKLSSRSVLVEAWMFNWRVSSVVAEGRALDSRAMDGGWATARRFESSQFSVDALANYATASFFLKTWNFWSTGFLSITGSTALDCYKVYPPIFFKLVLEVYPLCG